MPARSRSTLVLVLIAVAAGLGCKDGEKPASGAAASSPGAKSSAPQRPGSPVTLGPVRKGSAWRTVEVTGTLFGEEEATIASKLSGRVELLAVDVGDSAPSGTLLARIEARDHELGLAESQAALNSSLARLGLTELPGVNFDQESLPAVRRARAEAANAAARLDRAKKLFEQTPPLISEQDYADIRTANDVARETAETELLSARALLAEARAQETAVALARQRLSDTAVIAPVRPATTDGTAQPEPVEYEVAQRLVSLGEYVTPGQAMFRLVAMQQIEFRAEVAERFAGQVQPGQQVRVWVEAYAEPFPGEVTRVSPSIDPASRSFMIEVRIDNAERRLKPGAFARGEVRLREEAGVTFVPASAVVTFAGVTRVFSVEGGKAKEHRVRTGTRTSDEVEIIGELPAAEVVTNGAPALAEGFPVSVN